LGPKLAKTSTCTLDLANFEVVGHRKARIDQNENLRARFGQFEVVGGWLGQRKAKIDQNEHLRARFGQFRGGGWLGPISRWLGVGGAKRKPKSAKTSNCALDLVNSEVVRPKENPKRALTCSIWPKRKKTAARGSPLVASAMG